MAQLIDGKRISADIRAELKQETKAFIEKTGITPKLTVILVGEDPASQVYVRNKGRACEEIGFEAEQITLPATTTLEELDALVDRLNADSTVHGILVQLPLPKGLSEERVLLRIAPEKDVDAFHPYNVGRMVAGQITTCRVLPRASWS
jgi:methylenetetrahydrofolate dehydrogenase (NADP+)/methenyltetrahydrofolate cyclohydrolase